MIPIIIINGFKNQTKSDYKEIKWDYIILREQLPRLDNIKGKIYTNDDNEIDMYISCDSEDMYRYYIEICKKYGYTVDMKNGTRSYEAKKGEYTLQLYYYESSEYFSLELKKENNT